MLKIGAFATPTNVYTFYEVEETGYHRVDFVENGAAFNLEPEKVLFSVITQKSVHVYGDRRIYDEYQRVYEMLSTAQYVDKRDPTTSGWFNGTYFIHTTGVCAKFGYTREITKRNNRIDSMSLVGAGYGINTSILQETYDVRTRPLNYSEYTTVKLSKDTVQEKTDSIFHSAEYLKRHYDLAYQDKYDMRVVTSIIAFDAVCKEFESDPYPFRVFDTETTGLNVHYKGEDHMVGIVLGINPTTSVYLPFRHKGDFNLPEKYIKPVFEMLIQNQDKLIAHNKKFDREVALDEGYDLRIHYCTHQLSIILNPVLEKGAHGLKENAERLTGNHALELKEIFLNPKDIDFSVLPPEIIKIYACPDGINPLLLMEDMLPKLPSYQHALFELECALSDVKADQEFWGIRVDIKKFEHQYKNCNYILDMLLTSFRKLTREDGNINSSVVMSNLLYNKMHCPILLRTATGAPSVSVLAVKKIAKQKAKTEGKFTEDMVDLDGNVVISAEELNKSAYPALVIFKK